jgi:hypothetical protein
VLLRFLRQAPGRWFFHSELVLALGRSKGEIDWALLYLVREGWWKADSLNFPRVSRCCGISCAKV